MQQVMMRTQPRSIRVNLESIMPFLCSLIAFKSVLTYYKYISGPLSGAVVIIYNAITLLLFVLYIPLAMYICSSAVRFKRTWPAVIIPACVLINIVCAAMVGGLGIISRSYYLPMASGTNDEYGYYFAQINTWFGNMSVVILSSLFIKKKETIIRCVVSCLVVLLIPIVVIIIMHPNYLGLRQSTFENTSLTFGGGLWNIGVVGFGSMGWLAIVLQDEMTKNKRIFSFFAVAVFVFVGVAGISRTLILMVSFSFAYFLLFSKKDMSWLKKIVIIILLVSVFAIVESDLIGTIITRFTGTDAGSGNVRIKLWATYMSHFGECWLVGAPLGSVYNYYREYSLVGNYYLPHSAIVNFIIRFGLLSCIAYLRLIKQSFAPRNNNYDERKKHFFRAGLIAYITLAFINQTGYAEPIFYLMFGLWMALSNIYEKESKVNNI